MTIALLALGAGCLLPLLNLPSAVLGVVWGFAWGFQETAFVTVAMRFARGPWAATVFAVFMIFSNLGTSLGEALGAPSVSSLGYNGVFVGFALIAWASLVLLPGSVPPPTIGDELPVELRLTTALVDQVVEA